MSGGEAIDPSGIAIGISLFSMVVTAIVAYQAALRGTAVALARYEERQNYQGEDLRRLRNDSAANSELLSDHEARLSVVERVIDMRPPPIDFPRRA